MKNFFLKKLLLGNNVILNIIYGALYIVLYSHVWKKYCVPVWHAYYYENVAHSSAYEMAGYLVALFPVVFYRGIKNTSSWISVILYYFGYVPIILGTLFNYSETNDYNIVGYWVVLCLFMSLYFLADRSKWKTSYKKKTVPLNRVWAFVAISFVILLATNYSRMRLVSLDNVYDLRLQEGNWGGPLVGYIAAWAGTFTFPFVFCYGIYYHNKKCIIIGALLFVFQYSIFGLKSQLFAPLILLGLYKFFEWQEKWDLNLLPLFTIGISILSLWFMDNLDNPSIYLLAAVFLMRTLTISGCLFAGWYLPFFQSHPYTYFQHINFVNAITGGNPYAGKAIGTVVSEGGMNANAVFWAMDGITAGGVVGVFVVSLLFLIFLYYINSITTESNLRFVCILFVMPTIALLNVSFFTFLLSEGVLLIILTMFCVKLPDD